MGDMASGDMLSPQGDASPWISDEVSCCGETGQPVNMETTSNPAAVAELPMVQSSEESWESAAVCSKSRCSEEHVLTCTFEACDLERTGQVSVFHIIEYLQSVTGQSCEEGRLQLLYKMLDPEERGVTVDLPTFHAVMKNWIADCRQDGGLDSTKERDKFVDNMCLWPSGRRRPVSSAAQLEGYGGDVSSENSEEAAALMSSIEDLEYGNKKLAVQNAKLQRTIEAAEELNSRLTEELSQLQGRLRSTQQALEQAKSVANELEDLKAIAKSLEEEKGKLYSQARQLEKEQLCLSLQVDCLQEENRKLLAERDRVKQKVAGLVAEKADLKAQLCEYETLLSCKDTALIEKTNRAEELTVMLAEYRTVVQELRLEISQLQEQLCQTTEDLAITEERGDWSCPELCAHGAEEQLKLARGTSEEHSCLSCVETHVLPRPEGKAAKPICLETWPADPLLSSAAERSPAGGLQQGALVPVRNQLSPVKQKQRQDCWFETLAPWFRLGLICLLHRPQPHLLPSRLLLALLATLLLLPALCYLALPCRQQPGWTMPTGLAWPHLQLRYLRPPPL
ncbi:protein KASH5 isoform X5 [Chrysemys picta bellii]|uniref:protein KASH5 isoform X5 n=1 Tax=Chrysemys picta bellii TaxID=8478 RepID=UPI0032B2EC85